MPAFQEQVFGGTPCLIRGIGGRPNRSGMLLGQVAPQGGAPVRLIVQASEYGAAAKSYSVRSVLKLDGSPMVPAAKRKGKK
jgi:hypothetical protein